MKKLIFLPLVIFASATFAKPINTDCVYFDSINDLAKENVLQHWKNTNGTLYCEKYFIEKKGSKVKIYKVDDLVMMQVGSRN